MDGRVGGRGGGGGGGGGLRGQDPPDYMDSSILSAEDNLHRPADERTEIILAATFLVLVVLTFIAFMIYRCEKSFNRRKSERLPSSYSTVSIQTEPNISCNGGTTLMNGGSTALNGGIHTISNGAISTLPRYMNGGNHLPRDLGDIEEQVQDYRMDMDGSVYRSRSSKDMARSRESLEDPHQYRLKCEEILSPDSPSRDPMGHL
ncbi:uncharacterized protein LOC111715073 [Eurytemora carolleeae]|nr:uncharacterized protein LOC111715073 [Eurytemora carolleeae]XP_023346093.1 uncharacterized protein LOC111715073 [Eurytemora carolleeae]|eukprot:XP_023346092.1 uncharacterized protein LOC111715073 [Eurytemora affinis]